MGDTTLRPRKARRDRIGATRRATIAALALFGVALPASAAADHPGAGGGPDGVPAKVERALGGEVTALDNGLYEVESARGYSYTTHGPDPKTDEVNSTLTAGAAERAPQCIANPGTDYYQEVLYGFPADGTNDLAAQKASIQAQVRRNNALINRDSLASGGPRADFKLLCDADGTIKVTAFPVETGGGSSASFTTIVNSAKAAGFGDGGSDSNVDYTIFYDGSGSACGVGYFFSDESPGVNNLNNNPGPTGAGYGVSYRSCWFGRTSIHENAHNEGAAQYNAPNSTGTGAHCNELNDILCYVDGGDKNQSMIACPLGPPAAGGWYYDCNWNTYFDSAPEGGEWLATHWNIGSSVNRFITFWNASTPPETTIDAGVSGTTNNASPSFTFSANEPGSTFECSLAAPGATPSYTSCSSPKSYPGLADGAYELRVRATFAGNTDPTPALKTFTVDTAAPDTQIDAGPASAIATSSTAFSFSAAGGESAAFECSVDLAGFAPCTSPLPLSGLSDGVHTFAVRAIDGAGNTDASPAERAFAVDTKAPETSITNGPPDKLRVRKKAKVNFGFASPDAAAKFQCSFDNSPFASCSSPQKYSGVKRGTHQFLVRAIDAAGNVDQTPASDSFKVKKKRRRR